MESTPDSLALLSATPNCETARSGGQQQRTARFWDRRDAEETPVVAVGRDRALQRGVGIAREVAQGTELVDRTAGTLDAKIAVAARIEEKTCIIGVGSDRIVQRRIAVGNEVAERTVFNDGAILSATLGDAKITVAAEVVEEVRVVPVDANGTMIHGVGGNVVREIVERQVFQDVSRVVDSNITVAAVIEEEARIIAVGQSTVVRIGKRIGGELRKRVVLNDLSGVLNAKVTDRIGKGRTWQ